MMLFGSTSCEERSFDVAAKLLRSARDVSGLAEAVAEFAAIAEKQAEAGGVAATACRAGCPHCCVLNVTVLLPEAAAIADRLAGILSTDDLAGLAARLDHQRMRVRWMEDGERVRRQCSCPFLDGEGSCTIHPFRPLMCRGITSLDSVHCEEALNPAELDVPQSVPMDMVRKSVMDDAFCALARAAEERGMDSCGIELSAGVCAFLSRPGLFGQLLSRERLPRELWE